MGGYDSCSHKGIFSSREQAVSICIDIIRTEMEYNDQRLLDNLKDPCGLDPDFFRGEHREWKDKLQNCLDEGRFEDGGGSIDLPFIEEFDVDI